MKTQKTLMTLCIVLPAFCASAAALGDNPLSSVSDRLNGNRPLRGEQVVLRGAQPLSEEEMQTLRGGFIDPTGLIYRFAVNVRTALNGSEIFTRSLVLASTGTRGNLQASSSANVETQNIPSSATVTMVNNSGGGVVITDSNGNKATVLNQTSNGTPSSIILNTTSGANISQTVNMTLTLKNLSSSVSALAHTIAQTPSLQVNHRHSLGF